MKKIKFPWKRIVLVACFGALLVVVVLLYLKLSELVNQMAYLQDTTNVILSDVGNMQSNFEKTLEEENSLIESYSITVTDMDFTRGTYDVEVSVIPKEYTDSTRVSVYFGTAECPLKADGYTYSGAMTLPLEKTFDGNLTFLLANGKKKNTEVVEDYEGLYTHLDQVLTGSLAKDVSYRDGKISLNTECTYALDGVGMYEFDSLELVIELEGEEIGNIDLLAVPAETGDDMDGRNNGDDADAEEIGAIGTEARQDVQQIELPISGREDIVSCKFSYNLKEQLQEDEELPENPDIRIYLSAMSTEGYRFECDLSGGNERAVYDRSGGRYELE